MPDTTMHHSDSVGFQQSPWHSLVRKTSASHVEITSMFIYWLYSIFISCTALVQFFNLMSFPFLLLFMVYVKVFAPSIFLFYCKHLATLLFDDAVITIFVDDVSILTTAPKKEDAKTVTQSATNTVFYWSQQWKLDLNAS